MSQAIQIKQYEKETNMKVIFSRKGFDSSSGGGCSPIMPDGKLVSLPIPDSKDKDEYNKLMTDGISYERIISMIHPNAYKKLAVKNCHLDPDIYYDAKPRQEGWKPSFGQMSGALTQLKNKGVSYGDLFLFFGWFRQTEWHNGTLRFVKKAPNIHVIYGYLQIGNIIYPKTDVVPAWLKAHPHASYKETNNAIFVASDRLSIMPQMSGAGTFYLNERRILTKRGCSRSRWNLPDFFRDIPITGCNGWKEEGYFQSGGRGQEFIWTATEDAISWLKLIMQHNN